MHDINLIDRVVLDTNWATFLFLVISFLITLTKSIYSSRFSDFMKLTSTTKYINRYTTSNKNNLWFDLFFAVIQLISYSLTIHLILDGFKLINKYDFVTFLIILCILVSLKMLKFAISYFIASVFDISKWYTKYHFQKNSYKNLISIYLFPINLVLFFNDSIGEIVIYGTVILFILMNTFAYLQTLRLNMDKIPHKIIYFFLYLCTLEIAPYIVVCYWFISLNEFLS